MNAFKMKEGFIKIAQGHVRGVNKNISQNVLEEMSIPTLLHNMHPDDRIDMVKVAAEHNWITAKQKLEFDSNVKTQIQTVANLRSRRYV